MKNRYKEGHFGMEEQILAFVTYLHNVKNTSQNTEVSYQRDLRKLSAFLEERGIRKVEDITAV